MEDCRKPRSILHLDADAFFVSCELASRPDLKDRPVAVGGSKRGIIASANYVARAMGVITPMPTAKALRSCPSLTVIPGDYEKYERVSAKMFELLDYHTPVVERMSIDEGYADLSAVRHATPSAAAQLFRASVRSELGITVSLGLASNKLVAAVASKFRKPDSFTEVPPGSERNFLAPLSVRWLPGVGPKMESTLAAYGLECIADIASAPRSILEGAAGSYAAKLRAFSLGIDDSPVMPDREDPKSCAQQVTFERNISDRGSISRTLRGMADDLMSKIRLSGKSIRRVEVLVRYGDMSQCRRSGSLSSPTDIETDVYRIMDELLARAWTRQSSLRLVGLKFSGLQQSDSHYQQSLHLPGCDASVRRSIARTMDEVRSRFGPDALIRGHRL